MSLLDELNNDFDSNNENESEKETQENIEIEDHLKVDNHDTLSPMTFEEKSLFGFLKDYENTTLNNNSNFIFKYEKDILNIIDKPLHEEADLYLLTESLTVFKDQIFTLYKDLLASYNYSQELSSILDNDPEKFCQTLELLINNKSKEVPDGSCLLNTSTLTKEQVLLVTLQLQNMPPITNNSLKTQLGALINKILKLCELQKKITNFIKIHSMKVTPNLCNLVGPTIASQLISHGSNLKQLSLMPSSNLITLGQDGKQKKSILYYSSFVQEQNDDMWRKKALRILGGKCSLALRVDYLKSNTDGKLGLQWKKELENKIEKLSTPSNVTKIKPLPVPHDNSKKKRRGGRKLKKIKERYRLSYVQQLANKMAFGKEEKSVLNSFGEEVGLGLSTSRTALVNNSNNVGDFGLSKKMKKRLREESDKVKKYMLDKGDSFVLENPDTESKDNRAVNGNIVSSKKKDGTAVQDTKDGFDSWYNKFT
ncbi:uncharacterized protein SCODWIG_01656 [Saccharomycodes ludwigii]|uniref:Nop domain-containing protein n=1 Tax=Saccharomycodes ludwigii TaxID=36035 RepID=A0A376B5D4_9ASCO|nr:hypothetical protein SCDLUD_002349 [Saccharomycodes ludwigii]KAH3900890.1 hypothetical protein SCDLUD_002349 [Saccharomycodes ludwigii]SSD59895.1 uncharacterized protein SCODWIG_01656 [Saccharomycodes ludwigii]